MLYEKLLVNLERFGYCRKELDISKDIIIYQSKNNLVAVREYDNWKTVLEQWESDQRLIYNYLYKHLYNMNNVYFIIIMKQPVMDDEDQAIVELGKIDRDQYLLRKYVLIKEDDFLRISIFGIIDFKSVKPISFYSEYKKNLTSVLKEKSIEKNAVNETIDIVDTYFNEEEEA